MKYKYILFDLDGTISQSGEGIRYSLEMTCKDLGLENIDLSDYTKYIGPPLKDTLLNLCKLPLKLCDKGYQIYKNYYSLEGRYMNKPYEGIEAVLKSLKDKGAMLAVCSSKLEETAVKVMKDLGLECYFDAICGSNIECTRKDKVDLIPYAIGRLGGSMENQSQAVILGDTFYDGEGAQLCGVDFIACSYGYGSNEEMAKYNPIAWAHKPGDILDILH